MGAFQDLVQTGDSAIGGPAHEPLPEIQAGKSWRRVVVIVLAVLTLLGFVARFVLSWYSDGSDDWLFWWHFSGMLRYGPFKPYEMEPTLNHPPLPFLWSGIAVVTAWLVQVKFPVIFRLPCIAADIGSCLLLKRIWTRRGGDARWGWLAAAAFAWNLDAILVGAYHCNTDNICAFFTLLAAYQLVERRNFFAAGLAMAAAINVKVVPVVLLPVFFSLCRDWPKARQFVFGLSFGVIPFAIFLCVTPVAFARNLFGYTPWPALWGVMFFAKYSEGIPWAAATGARFYNWVHLYGKYPMLAIAAGLGVLSWRRPRWNAYELGALAWCAFLIFTPGWGWQYTVYVAPLLMAAKLGRGALYGLIAGLYLLAVYSVTWDGTLPLTSVFDYKYHPNPLPVPMALLAWSILVSYFVTTLARGFTRKI